MSGKRVKEFELIVQNKFNVYNSLFLNLPYRKVSNIGMLIPLLTEVCKKGLESGDDPLHIMDNFLATHASLQTEQEKIDFMFRVIQYVERQVVLYDSVEDAAFPKMKELGDYILVKDFFQLLNSKKNWDRISEKLSNFSSRLVLTAHPTQFYPPSVLNIIRNLRTQISGNNIDEIDVLLQQLGLTSLMNSEKPTPLEEAKNIIYFLRNVYYHTISEFYAYLKKNIHNKDFNNPDIIKLGFWPGGDRDGNPFVTATTTMDVANELRMTLMKCYYQDVKKLQQKLTFRGVDNILSSLRRNIYPTMFDPSKTISQDDLISPLYAMRDLLINKFHSQYLNDLDNLIDKVNIFKTHFATLDVRQDHSMHIKVIEAILRQAGLINESIDELSKKDLKSILLHQEVDLEQMEFEEDIVQDTIKNITQLQLIQQKNGEEGCNRYVISNSEDIFSVLFVHAFFRWCWKGKKITFDIIPLFETMDGMNNSEQVMLELFDTPEYRAHVKERHDKQTIMLGFSDGTKDGGYLKANWEIFKTKETLSAVCDQNDIKAIFFDGRGGPPARGGGKTHRFYASQSQKIANNEIQLTIQGQTITSTYGTQEQFTHNCEQLLSAGLTNTFFGKEHIISDNSRQLMEELAQVSYDKYKALKNHEKFLPYLENKSTLRYYGKTNIGSRPGKRGNSNKLAFSDLRAISFVGSWSQLKQNVPGYFGIGTAINNMKENGKLEALKNLFLEVPFFKALILNSMMSLSKCYFDLTNYMSKDPEYGEFWNILRDEYDLSKEMVLLISGYEQLMEEEPVSKKSISIREQIVLPLLMIQQYALQQIGQESDKKDIYEKMVIRSLYGNINASRNSV